MIGLLLLGVALVVPLLLRVWGAERGDVTRWSRKGRR